MKDDPNIEANRILQFLASQPYGNTTTTRRILRAILLQTDGWMMACGELWDIKSKNIGAGVYRITLTKK